MGKGIRKKILIIMAAVVMVAFVGLAAVKAAKNKQETGMIVRTAEIVKQDIESRVQSSGQVIAVDKRSIISDVSGKVLDILVENGDRVETNQVLVRIDDSEISHQIQQGEIRLAIERETLEKIKNRDKLDLEIAVNNGEIQYNEARNNYEQIKALYELGAASQNEMNLAKNRMEQLYNNLILARKNLENVDTLSDVSIQEKQLELSKLSLNKLREELNKYTINSPMIGYTA